MSLATLKEVLSPALQGGYAVAGLVCLGWEDMRAYVAAAEAEGVAVILQAGPGCRAHTPLPVLGSMLRFLAENASVPVVVHLDHGYSYEECQAALESGFTSLMFDGSKLPLEQNIEATAQVVQLAHQHGLSCEGELGFVGYDGGAGSQATDPQEAAHFVQQSGVDALAISVGNTHLQQSSLHALDEERIRAIETTTQIPLVIHGGSGVPPVQRRTLAQTSAICKFNIGTELRMAFGQALRQAVNQDTQRFDRLQILQATHQPLVAATQAVLRTLKPAAA